MSGIWIRSEDGTMLMLAQELLVASDDGITWWLYVGKHQVGVYKTHQQAMRQLDDIQAWMQGSGSNIGPETRVEMDLIYPNEGLQKTTRVLPTVYDLRERKVKEGGQ